MSVSTNWSSSTSTSSNWSQPTTTLGSTTVYDTAKAYNTAAYYDGIVTIPTIQYNSTNWAIGCFIAIILSSLIFAGGVL